LKDDGYEEKDKKKRVKPIQFELYQAQNSNKDKYKIKNLER